MTVNLDWNAFMNQAIYPALMFAVPIVISQIKGWVGTEKKWMLPVLAPVVGIAADFLAQYLAHTSVGPVAAAVMGALGVWLREVYDQLRKAST